MILIQMLTLSMRILHLNIVIEALLTSSFCLIPRLPSNLSLQTSSQATKGNLHVIKIVFIIGKGTHNTKRQSLIKNKNKILWHPIPNQTLH